MINGVIRYKAAPYIFKIILLITHESLMPSPLVLWIPITSKLSPPGTVAVPLPSWYRKGHTHLPRGEQMQLYGNDGRWRASDAHRLVYTCSQVMQTADEGWNVNVNPPSCIACSIQSVILCSQIHIYSYIMIQEGTLRKGMGLYSTPLCMACIMACIMRASLV